MPAVQVNFRIDPDVLALIDHNAMQAGMTRTDYILQFLPECYDRTTPQPSSEQRSNDR